MFYLKQGLENQYLAKRYLCITILGQHTVNINSHLLTLARVLAVYRGQLFPVIEIYQSCSTENEVVGYNRAE